MSRVTRNQLLTLAVAATTARQALKDAFKDGLRARDPAAYDRLVIEFGKRIDAAYPENIVDWLLSIDAGNGDAIDQAVVYIEADPWLFRSGYFKDKLLRRLRRANLTETQRDRLRTALLAVVDGRDRREFRRFCRLAHAIADDAFRQKLADRATDANFNEGQRRRARWMLAALPRVQSGPCGKT